MAQHPFTIKYNEIVNILITDVSISEPSKKRDEIKTFDKLQYKAIWDTGATGSVITKKVVRGLGIKPVSIVEVTSTGGKFNADLYLINMYLPNKLIIPFVQVIACDKLTKDDDDSIEILIGMDIISLSDFAITNKKDTWFSFRMPSVSQIDFKKEDI